MKNSNKNSEETINYQLKMKRPVLLLLLGVLMCLPLAEANANYYYKVQRQNIDGTGKPQIRNRPHKMTQRSKR